MVNGLAVLGWGVGGIEAEAAMLGQPISMLLPEVIGFKPDRQAQGRRDRDRPRAYRRADAAQARRCREVRRILRPRPRQHDAGRPGYDCQHGAGIRRDLRLLPNRRRNAALSEMSGRTEDRIELVEAYAKAQGMFRDDRRRTRSSPIRSNSTSPKSSPRWLDRSVRKAVIHYPTSSRFRHGLDNEYKLPGELGKRVKVESADYDIGHGDVAIAAITSCTNTSNPSVLIGAGLLARNAVEKGLTVKPWVKTSLHRAVRSSPPILKKAGLQPTSMRSASTSSASAAPPASATPARCRRRSRKAINENGIVAASVLSGNRNFEGRVSPDVQANYLASPPLVVAYALAGTVNKDLTTEPLGNDKDGNPVFLKDIWPTGPRNPGLRSSPTITRDMFKSRYCRCLRRGRELAGHQDVTTRADLRPGMTTAPTFRTRRTSKACNGLPPVEDIVECPHPRHVR
jgi:aconitate hydratase